MNIYNDIRNINLYIICDSYLFSFIKSDSIFCGVKEVFISRWGIEDPIEIVLDTTKINVLLIERVERVFPYMNTIDYCSRFKVVNKKKIASAENSYCNIQQASFALFDFNFMKKIHEIINNNNINQNLEFNLFDYQLFTPLKELKASLNYKLFNRSCKEVATIPGIPYLFLSETIDSTSAYSSFFPVSNVCVKNIVDTLNLTYQNYKRAGFDLVYYTICPNPISIIYPEYGNYNDIIRRVQGHPDLLMPMIDLFDEFSKTKYPIYYNSDSHWNYNGFNLWLNKFNSCLKIKKENFKNSNN